MKTENIIKALKKCGYSVEKIVENRTEYIPIWEGNELVKYEHKPYERISYRAESKNYVGTWWDSDYISSVHVVSKSQEKDRDIQTDYFPGSFCRTIKNVCRFMEDIKYE